VTPTLALDRFAAVALRRLEALRVRVEAGDEAAWPAYCETATALAAVVGQTAPGSGGKLMTTRELADAIGVSPKTVLRRRKAGRLTPALELGQRGSAALRWARP
jgi:hypothetical protein